MTSTPTGTTLQTGARRRRLRIVGRLLIALAVLCSGLAVAIPADAAAPRITVVRGRLTITGTNAAETITISPQPEEGTVAVTITGSASIDEVYRGVTGSVTVRGRGGDDLLVITGSTSRVFLGDLTFDGGAGDDTLRVFEGAEPYVFGRLAFRGGAGDDTFDASGGTLRLERGASVVSGAGELAVDVDGALVDGRFDIIGGSKADSIAVTYSRFSTGLKVRTVAGNDKVRLFRNHYPTVEVDTGTGNDTFINIGENVDDMTLKTGPGNDWITLQSSVMSEASVLAGPGNDAIETFGNNSSDYTIKGEAGHDTMTIGDISSETLFDGGSGNDHIELVEHIGTGGRFTIDAGSGNDTTRIDRSVFEDHVLWKGGSGNDRVAAFASIFGYTSQFDGGAGTDSLDGEGNSFSHGPVLVRIP